MVTPIYLALELVFVLFWSRTAFKYSLHSVFAAGFINMLSGTIFIAAYLSEYFSKSGNAKYL